MIGVALHKSMTKVKRDSNVRNAPSISKVKE